MLHSPDQLPVTETEKVMSQVRSATWKALDTYQQLGPPGIQYLDKPNRFGEKPLVVDVEIEKAVIHHLAELHLPMRIVSEEHEEQILNPEKGDARYTIYLDGLDGSTVHYRSCGKKPAGTMVGVYEGARPRFCDAVYGAIMMYPDGTLYDATRRGLAQSHNDREKSENMLQTARATSHKKTDLIIVNPNYGRTLPVEKNIIEQIAKKVPPGKRENFGSTAYHAIRIVTGLCPLVIEATRKDNLELAALYLLVIRSGGSVETDRGVSIAENVIDEFGVDPPIAVLIACNKDYSESFRLLNRI